MVNIINSIKKTYAAHQTKFIVGIVVVVIASWYALTYQPATTSIIVSVTKADLKQTILSTGQVTSNTDLNLSFQSGGLIKTLPASVGSKVGKGQVLAIVDNRKEYADLLGAQGSLESAKANYKKIVEGSTSQEVAVAQASLDTAKANLENAKKVQDTLLSNAQSQMLNSDTSPVLVSGQNTGAPTITGTYNGTKEGTYTIKVNSGFISFSGLEEGVVNISTTAPVAIGNSGLFIQFPVNYFSSSNNVWQILLPNKSADSYLSNFNAYKSALKNHDSIISQAESAVNQSQADLDLKKAAARSSDMDAAQAQVLIAQSKVDAAQAAYDDTILRAPQDGTIVHVDTKIGERVDPQKEIIVLQDVGNLYVEANVNETSISKIAEGENVSMTLDAFGPDTKFEGSVIHIDPSSTTSDGVVNYKIKSSIKPTCSDSKTCADYVIRPGMNANMVITAWIHSNVVSVSKAALVVKNGATYVNVVGKDTSDLKLTAVSTGMLGDGNMIEITSGLTGSERISVPE